MRSFALAAILAVASAEYHYGQGEHYGSYYGHHD